MKTSKNCIIKTWKEDVGDMWYDGLGWTVKREKARRYSLPEVETAVDNMRSQEEMAFWERYDNSRTSL